EPVDADYQGEPVLEGRDAGGPHSPVPLAADPRPEQHPSEEAPEGSDADGRRHEDGDDPHAAHRAEVGGRDRAGGNGSPTKGDLDPDAPDEADDGLDEDLGRSLLRPTHGPTRSGGRGWRGHSGRRPGRSSRRTSGRWRPGRRGRWRLGASSRPSLAQAADRAGVAGSTLAARKATPLRSPMLQGEATRPPTLRGTAGPRPLTSPATFTLMTSAPPLARTTTWTA